MYRASSALRLLAVSSTNLTLMCRFLPFALALVFLPLNHQASKFVIVAQDNLMKARDERVSLMNEVRRVFEYCPHI